MSPAATVLASSPESPEPRPALAPTRASEPPPRSGPRERALDEGVAALGDGDLLAVLLGTGLAGQPVALVAGALLDRFGGLGGLARVGPAALAAHPGVGLAKALRLAAALELGRRHAARTSSPREPVRTSAEVAARFGPRLGSLDHEEMWVLSLDGRNHLRGSRKVAQGGLHGCSVTARDILRVALADAASAIVLVHNHPSGDPTPSLEDVAMTRAVADAASIVGVPLVDHVVLASGGRHASLLDLGVFDPG
jgi:DNA repair protein RadC